MFFTFITLCTSNSYSIGSPFSGLYVNAGIGQGDADDRLRRMNSSLNLERSYQNVAGLQKSTTNYGFFSGGVLFNIGRANSPISFSFGPEYQVNVASSYSFQTQGGSDISYISGSYLPAGLSTENYVTINLQDKYAIFGKAGIVIYDMAMFYGFFGASYGIITMSAQDNSGKVFKGPEQKLFGRKGGVGLLIKMNDAVKLGIEYEGTFYDKNYIYPTVYNANKTVNISEQNYRNTVKIGAIKMYLNIKLF